MPLMLFDVIATLPTGKKINILDVQAATAAQAEMVVQWKKWPLVLAGAKLEAVRPRFAVVGFRGRVRWQGVTRG